MSETKNTTFIFAAVLGLLLAVYSTATAQNIDAAPEAPESAVAASEFPTDSATPDPETAGDASEGAEIADSDDAAQNPAKQDPTGTAKDVYDALKAGQWLIAFGLSLFFLVWGLRLLLMFMKVKWVGTKAGGFILAFGTSFALAIGTALVAGQPLSIGLFTAAAVIAWAAAGKNGHFNDVLDWMRGVEKVPKARVVKLGDTA